MSDLSELDANALVGRLAVVREKVLGLPDRSPDKLVADRAEVEAVLEECGVRLLRSDPGFIQTTLGGMIADARRLLEQCEANLHAGAYSAEADRNHAGAQGRYSALKELRRKVAGSSLEMSQSSEVERFRGIIRGVAFYVTRERCPLCLQPHESHVSSCPWPALVAEADLGSQIQRDRVRRAKKA